MDRLQWGRQRDSAYVALLVGGIAVALGSAALFGMVAHTWTPFLPQKGAGASAHDSSRGRSAVQTKLLPEAVQAKPDPPKAIAIESPPAQLAATEAASAPAPATALPAQDAAIVVP